MLLTEEGKNDFKIDVIKHKILEGNRESVILNE